MHTDLQSNAEMDPRHQAWVDMDRDTLDFQLSPSRSAKDAAGALNQMIADTQAAAVDAEIVVRANIPYGPRPRQKLDVFLPRQRAKEPLPSLMFIHGGFWQEGDKSVSGFAASTFARLGWATISVGYTLTPEISLTELVEEIRAAWSFVQRTAGSLQIDPARVVLAGHSAGAHLAACLIADAADERGAGMPAGGVLISGVFELAPIAGSYVNDLVRMTSDDVASLSPVRRTPAAGVPIHVLIGADEPAAFQIQSDVLVARWRDCGAPVTVQRVPGRDHFDILEMLKDPGSETVRTILTMA